MKYLFIDIRQSNEVYQKQFDASSYYKVYQIPMNMIRFNQNMIIEHLEYYDEIYIVCRTGRRAQFIKDKYFANNSKIIVDKALQFAYLRHGKNIIKLADKEELDQGKTKQQEIKVNIIGSNSFNLYNMMLIIQIIMGTLILVLGGYTYYQIKDKIVFIQTIPLLILMGFGLMALFNGLTATCIMSKLLMNYLN